MKKLKTKHAPKPDNFWFIVGIVLVFAWSIYMQSAPAPRAMQQAATLPNIVVATCGTPPSNYPAVGVRAPGTVDTTGAACGAAAAVSVNTSGLASQATLATIAGAVGTYDGTFPLGTIAVGGPDSQSDHLISAWIDNQSQGWIVTPWLNGIHAATGSGASSAQVQRVILASDQTAIPLAAGSATIGALTANQTVDMTRVGGGATATVGTGVQKVAIVDSAGNSILNTDTATVIGGVTVGAAATTSLVIQGAVGAVPVATNMTQVGSTAVVAAATPGMVPTAPSQVFNATAALPAPARTVGQVVNTIVNTDGALIVMGNDCGNSGLVQSVAITTSGIGYTQLVALTASQRILICGINFIANGTTNVTISYGTGVQCATGTTALSGAYPLTAQVGMALPNAGSVQLPVPAGQALCFNNSAAIQVSGFVTFVKRL